MSTKVKCRNPRGRERGGEEPPPPPLPPRRNSVAGHQQQQPHVKEEAGKPDNEYEVPVQTVCSSSPDYVPLEQQSQQNEAVYSIISMPADSETDDLGSMLYAHDQNVVMRRASGGGEIGEATVSSWHQWTCVCCCPCCINTPGVCTCQRGSAGNTNDNNWPIYDFSSEAVDDENGSIEWCTVRGRYQGKPRWVCTCIWQG